MLAGVVAPLVRFQGGLARERARCGVEIGDPDGDRRRSLRGALALLLLTGLLATGLFACAAAPAPGPAFTPAAPPAPGHARIYLYRIDPHRSLSTVELALDGRERGALRAGEYATFELAAGAHALALRQRGFGFTSWGWNRMALRLEPGETVYIEVSVRVAEQSSPAGSGRDLEIAGRDRGAAQENVFVQRRSESQGRERIAASTRRGE